MKKFLMAIAIAAGLAGTLTISGCTQMPTEKQSVSDLRPQISFKVTDERLHRARVILDGLDMGMVGNYIEGYASMRILPGTHILQVDSAGQTIFNEKFYIGDGVNRAFIVK